MNETPLGRFRALFGPNANDRLDLPRILREQVYFRMRPALTETDGRKLRKVRTHFLKTFHPDAVDSVFTLSERQAVFITIPHIFEGEELS